MADMVVWPYWKSTCRGIWPEFIIEMLLLRGSPARPKALKTMRQKLIFRPRKELRNEVSQERLSRALDATKEYAHNFQDGGRFGSHPSHDRFDDEGMP
jgi:hypothetical protein